MNDLIFAVVSCVGIFASGWGVGTSVNDTIALSRDLKAQCEAQLPRDQICVMRYVPEALE